VFWLIYVINLGIMTVMRHIPILLFCVLVFAAPSAPAASRAEDYFSASEIETGKKFSAEKLGFWTADLLVGIAFWTALLALGLAAGLEKTLLRFTGNRFWAAALLFFLSVFLLQFIVDYPLSFLRSFRHNHAYGLSNLTFAAWTFENLKMLAISLILAVPGFTALYLVMRLTPARWWLWMSAFLGIILLVMTELWPVAVNPLFNKFTPVAEGSLRNRVVALAAKAGMDVDDVYVMDASRQSKHTNAYFTGLAKNRRIVLYDNLVKDNTEAEVTSVIAHEIGHWKHNHIWKGLAFSIASIIFFFFLADKALAFWAAKGWCGVASQGALAGAPVLYLLITLATTLSLPLQNAVSRQFERTADREAILLTNDPATFISSMQKLARRNLSDVEPSPLKEWIFYSHPSAMERIREAEKLIMDPSRPQLGASEH
jgi:STE24 endopeptidase